MHIFRSISLSLRYFLMQMFKYNVLDYKNLTFYLTIIFFDWSKLKSFADYKINVKFFRTEILFGMDGKHCGEKGENAGYHHFLIFSECFQKLSFPGVLKVGIVWEKS